jgi:hypothetical protein
MYIQDGYANILNKGGRQPFQEASQDDQVNLLIPAKFQDPLFKRTHIPGRDIMDLQAKLPANVNHRRRGQGNRDKGNPDTLIPQAEVVMQGTQIGAAAVAAGQDG